MSGCSSIMELPIIPACAFCHGMTLLTSGSQPRAAPALPSLPEPGAGGLLGLSEPVWQGSSLMELSAAMSGGSSSMELLESLTPSILPRSQGSLVSTRLGSALPALPCTLRLASSLANLTSQAASLSSFCWIRAYRTS